MVRTTPELLYQTPSRVEQSGRRCQHPGCAEEAAYRAPMARDRLTQYYWFCLEHVRDYNKAWDYFKGMNEAQIEAQRRHDTVWQRPSWPLGGGFFGARADLRPHDDFGLFGEPAQRSVRLQSEEEKALAILDLERPSDFTQIKARYMKLVKQLHPDANGGDKEAEERLKFVNQAYTTLKSSFAG